MSTSPFIQSPELTAIAIAHRNPAYTLIADQVLPFTKPELGQKEFRYLVYDLAGGYTVPNLAVGRTGAPGRVETKAEERDGSTTDFGLDYPVPQDDITQAKAKGTNPLGFAAEFTANLVTLGRESRIAGLTFNPASYAAANVEALAGTARFDDFVNSDPVGVVSTMMDRPLIRPNRLVFGKKPWGIFRRHPKVLKAIFPNGGGEGMATRQQVMDLFEVNELFVGESFINAAKKGQAADLQQVWGNHIAAHFIDPTANNKAGVTWGYTLRFGTKQAGTVADGDISANGGQRVRVVDSLAEMVVCPEVGGLILNATN